MNHNPTYGSGSNPATLNNSMKVDALIREAVEGATHGVVKLTLRADSYDLEFVPDTSSGYNNYTLGIAPNTETDTKDCNAKTW